MPPLVAVVLGFGLVSGFSVHAADSQNSTKSALLDTAGFAATVNEDAELAFPEILRHEDVDLYRQIFNVQEDGQWKQADRLIKQLKDRELMGHVMAQRYLHPTKYRSK